MFLLCLDPCLCFCLLLRLENHSDDERIKNKNGLVNQAVFCFCKDNMESGQLSPSPRQSRCQGGAGRGVGLERVYHIHMARHRITGAAPGQVRELDISPASGVYSLVRKILE